MWWWLVCGEENVQFLRRIFGGAAAVVGQSVVHVLPFLLGIYFICQNLHTVSQRIA